jgi:hypothetical protein
MNTGFLLAAVLTALIGLVHSVLGERLVFSRMRQRAWVPTEGGSMLREHHVRILWASWHALSVLGWGQAALLFWLAQAAQAPLAQSAIPLVLAATCAASSCLVLIGTRGRHLGWVALLVAAALTLAGTMA